ncbi:MAG: type II toxin-antitoxin system RelE/ParE family toxin [Acidobacteria bacterium]|nr:type II toxin-antitoxin system RelE/ParE family toxin [Acidobacteriota bacterium]
MGYKVRFQPAAVEELEDAVQWLELQSAAAAAKWHQQLLDAVDALETLPAMCPQAPESRFFGEEIRQILVGGYRVLYRIKDDVVDILHIRHGSRDWLRSPRSPDG